MRLSKSEREERKAEAIKELRALLPAGSTVHLVLKNVSRSGMSRTIACYALTPGADGNNLTNVSWFVANACDLRFKDGYSGGVMITGCGMDMGLALVSALSYELYGKPCDQTTSYREGQRKPNGGIWYRWI